MTEPHEHAFDPDFLDVRAPLPTAPADAPLRELTYTHFTVLLDPRRRLAAATGVNIDGAGLLDLGRGDDWHLDPRVDADEQAGPELYARNDLDRGHLVRRRDPVWGPVSVAGRANADTFAYPNAAPQAARFNQSKELWNGLEDYLLEHARAHRLRLTVLTGTVLDAADPVYRGVGIPRLFWKVAAWADVPGDADPGSGARLASTAYVLDQTPQLDEIDLRAATAQALAAGDVPPLGPFRTFQVPVRDVEALTRLDLGPLVAADRLAAVSPQDDGPVRRVGWVPLASAQDIRL
ncbi:DNA/RNA non-specific endonuclease [Cellulomonas cellasea]|uniref:Endonuclease G n=1 Tax=Cellulomonas cellasea TaxID=43670 RepID=A0A7W4UCS4_9CELL|nr:DNA/RNA non-specific endonuclease [Cellulomonas cellasea]MBB2921764.1 endonuclease G [Cellulomonas cellasea]